MPDDRSPARRSPRDAGGLQGTGFVRHRCLTYGKAEAAARWGLATGRWLLRDTHPGRHGPALIFGHATATGEAAGVNAIRPPLASPGAWPCYG